MPGVHSVHLLTGGRIVAHVHIRSPAYGLMHLHKASAQLAGVLTYDASEALEGHERAHAMELPENVEVPCHQCKGPIHADPVKGRFGERTHVFCCRQCLGTFRDRYEALQQAATTPTAAASRKAAAARTAALRVPTDTRTNSPAYRRLAQGAPKARP